MADQILKIISEEIKINHYKLRKLTNENLRKLNLTHSPSNSQFEATINELLNRKLIIKTKIDKIDGKKGTWFEQSEIEKIRNRFNYGLEEYLKIYKTCQMISVFAALGITKVKRINPHHAYAEKVRGVSVEDIIERRHIGTQANFENLNFKREDLNEYFAILKEKGIIRILQIMDNEIRYIASNKYKKFLLDVWVYLYSKIDGKISNKWRYVDKPNSEEIGWYETMYGKKACQKNIINCNLIRKEIRSNKSKIYDRSIIQNKSNNLEIIRKYENISGKYHSLNDDLFGFRDIVISVVCPKGLLNSIKNEISKDII